MDHTKSVQFMSIPPSDRAPSASAYTGSTTNLNDLKSKLNLLGDDGTPGCRAKDVYDTTLPWWRAGVRRKVVSTLHWESQIIAKMQERIRTPWLDSYFVYSSIFGTHTFFMIILPTLIFFGYSPMGRGLCLVLGLGIYIPSVIKDLFCSPRPFAPPVTRLTIGSHHLEYGFPSTHSTNGVSIALFFFAHIHRLANTSAAAISPELYSLLCTILFLYAFSVVFGRLYTAMHSFTDCIAGTILGASIWWWHTDWAGIPCYISASNPIHNVLTLLGFGEIDAISGSLLVYVGKGLRAGEWTERWIREGGWEVPLILIPLYLLAVHYHPQPVDDCPCFEDSIAILSVVLGVYVSRWVTCYTKLSLGGTVVMPGSGWLLVANEWVRVERGLSDILLWWSVAVLKNALGVLIIFVWRIIAKSALHLILPPTYRLLARAFQLPHRRFYTPATEYKSVPSEFHSSGDGGGFGLHPIPSVIDLPSPGQMGVEVGGIGSGVEGVSNVEGVSSVHMDGERDVKIRSGTGASLATSGSLVSHDNEKIGSVSPGPVLDKESTGKEGQAPPVKHYDADVLTKLIVYAGIAVIGGEVVPLIFDLLGWGGASWPVGE
ncbi:hypothetical protein M413DRAFT_430272 [Hebeloma cylindrosporum]|uniref:Phosphatidic acid phosphatase type 2/haloperoxidase domain-containing protein n=1 Tax=Hebeloma cylindrosporum TaxID=76867 RepID=A0A0C3CP32_HEBCY|nr:hypothetical protein M413DRAFT_430272 [Hebeloma cylindrosporum h7]